MTTSARRLVAALSLSTALVASSAALAAPAHAEQWKHRDAAGDVMLDRSSDDEEPPGDPVVAPDYTRGDITKVVVGHTRRALTIKVRTRGPVPAALMVGSSIKTPRKQLLVGSMKIPGFMNSTELWDFAKKGDDPRVRCRGLKRTISADRRAVTLTVPTSCIGNPAWVRVSAHLSTLTPNGDSYEDDGLRPGLSAWGADKMSPRIKRG